MNPIKNKGMYLEEIINITNQKYLYNKICIVSKMPTNIKTIHTNFKHQIDNAKFLKGENCDYIGCYKGIYFEFDAKETSKTTFSFSNIRKNQIEKLNHVISNKGVAFLLIYFSSANRYFMVDWSIIFNYFSEYKRTIAIEWFYENSIEVFINSNLMLDYISNLHYLTNYI